MIKEKESFNNFRDFRMKGMTFQLVGEVTQSCCRTKCEKASSQTFAFNTRYDDCFTFQCFLDNLIPFLRKHFHVVIIDLHCKIWIRVRMEYLHSHTVVDCSAIAGKLSSAVAPFHPYLLTLPKY